MPAGMSSLGVGTDLAISVRGPAAQIGITSLKATHGRVPVTGIWPRVPRRFCRIASEMIPCESTEGRRQETESHRGAAFDPVPPPSEVEFPASWKTRASRGVSVAPQFSSQVEIPPDTGAGIRPERNIERYSLQVVKAAKSFPAAL